MIDRLSRVDESTANQSKIHVRFSEMNKRRRSKKVKVGAIPSCRDRVSGEHSVLVLSDIGRLDIRRYRIRLQLRMQIRMKRARGYCARRVTYRSRPGQGGWSMQAQKSSFSLRAVKIKRKVHGRQRRVDILTTTPMRQQGASRSSGSCGHFSSEGGVGSTACRIRSASGSWRGTH